MKLAWTALLAALFVVVVGGRVARAQSAPQMQIAVDTDVVELGGTLTLQMQVTASDVSPTDPDHGPIPGFVVRGQSTMPSRMTSIVNGVRSDRVGLTATWQLQAKKVGTFRLGPPTISYQGARYAGSSVTVKVVPAGQAPQRSQDPFGSFSPFDPWKGLIQQPPPDPTPEPDVTPDPKFGLDAPRGAFAFLHATLDKTSAVVGEQVTLTIYLYIDAAAADAISLDDPHDATTNDFVRHSISSDDSFSKHVAYAQAGGKIWSVRVASRWALFPLKTGHLEIGGMSLRLARPRGAGSPVRSSETLHVDVSGDPYAIPLERVERTLRLSEQTVRSVAGKRLLASAGNALDAELTALTAYMGDLDEGLGRSAGVSASKMRYQMNRLRRMAANFELQKEASLARHAQAVTQALHPHGGLQERLIGAAYFLARYGSGLVDKLVREGGDGCPGHKVIRL